MTDAAEAGSSAGGLLEGLLGGFEGGYSFREGIKSNRRRRQLETDLMTLRQQEGQRAASREAREETVFDEQQAAYNRAESLRKEVATHIAAPHGHTLGEYLEGRPGSREVGTPPLSRDAQTAQAVGRTMGEFGGRDLTGDQALLVGSGAVPYGAIAPKAYHPRTRAEWLDNLRLAAGIRGTGTKLPITLDHAFATLDRIYTVQDPQTGAWTSRLKPADRLRIAKKMVAGTVQPTDFPDMEAGADSSAAQPTSAPAGGGHRSLMQRIGDVFTGGPSTSAAPAGRQQPNVQAPEGPMDPARMERARTLIGQYRDLPLEDLEDALREQGYSDEEIRQIIGSP